MAYWVQGLVQLSWIQLFVWYTLPAYASLGIGVCMALLCGWAFADAQTFYDDREVRSVYLASVPVTLGLLLSVDLFGGPGLVAVSQQHTGALVDFLIVEGLVVVVSQMALVAMGSISKQHATSREDQANLLAANAALVAQRETVQTALLGHGLSASEFSHDVRGPIMVLTSSIDVLGDSPPQQEVPEILADMRSAADQLLSMTRLLAESVKDPDRQAPASVSGLVDQALRAMKVQLQDEDCLAPTVGRIEPGNVLISHAHAAALGNVLTNSTRYTGDDPVEIIGARDGDHYVLSIRDHGTEGAERDEALRRVASSLRLESHQQSDRGSYGIGLMMAKILLQRHGGDLTARPADGAGIVMEARMRLVEVV